MTLSCLGLTFPLDGIAARARIENKTGTPYLGAIALRNDTGETIFKKNEEISCYPASIVKLMVLLIIQEKIEDGSLNLNDQVICTAEAARMGGSQVYLKEHEIFTIEELIYSLIIQSANDSAVALAIHIAGSKDSFVEIMQKKAQELGMKDTEFHSVHGLPPGKGQVPDISTPRDIAILCRELLKHPDILNYTSTQVRGFRDNSFEMRSHNPLLESFEGCDGLKTGYFRAGGFSIAATAERDGLRVIAVVMGSKNKEDRNKSVGNILAQAFSSLPTPGDKPESEIPRKEMPLSGIVQPDKEENVPPSLTEPENADTEKKIEPKTSSSGLGEIILYILIFLIQAAFFFWLGRKTSPNKSSGFPPTILK